MNADQRFRKYQIIELDASKASDPRPESFSPDLDSVKVVGELPPDGGPWLARRERIAHLIAPSLCDLVKRRDAQGYPTLGVFRPAKIDRLIIRPVDDPQWTPQELARLRQFTLFEKTPAAELEKMPVTFYYKFWCDDPDCRSHELSCTDWEMAQSYRSWRDRYGDEWEAKFRETYEGIIMANDTHFYVGTVHGHPNRWIIVGLFYPKSIVQPGLPFD
jgi:hypothetical protein